MWQEAFDSLEKQLTQLRNASDLSDRVIAEAVRNAAWRQDVPAPLASDSEREDVAFRLAWWVFVRAPALNVRYFLVGPMSLDLVIGEDRGLDELMDELRQLEESNELDADEEYDFPISLDFLDEHLDTFRRHARLADRVHELGRAELEPPLSESMAMILANEEDFRKLYAEITERFVEEFDELAKSGAFEDVLHGGAHEHVHDQEFAELDSAQEYVERAEERFAKGDLHGAIDDASAALELEADSVQAFLQRGVARAAHEDVEDAIDDFGEALEREPECLPALINRGLAFYGNRQFEEALEDFDTAVEVDPEAPEIYANRGIVRFALDDQEGAEADFDKAIDLDPDSVIAMVHRAAGEVREAVLDYQKALELDENYAEAWAALGYIFLDTQYFDKAINHLDRAIELQPYAAEHYYNRGNAYAGGEDFAQAIEDYSRAIDLDEEDVESYLNRGLAKLKRQDFNGAIDDWTRAIEIDPYNPMPYAKRAGVWNMLDQTTEAARDLHQAMELAPEDWEYADFAHEMLNDIVEQMGYDPTQKD